MTRRSRADADGLNDPVMREIITARVRLLMEKPFFGRLATRLVAVEAAWCETAATDGKHLFFNRNFIKSLSRPQLLFLICHEVLHCVLDHIGRRDGRDPELWNMAIDYVTNYMLVEEKIGRMPDSGLYSAKFTDALSADEVYAQLKRNSVTVRMPLDTHLDFGGDNADDTTPTVDVTVTGTDGPPQLSAADLEKIRNEFRAFLFQSAQQEGAGNVPAGVRRMIDQLTRPKLDWRSLLDSHLRSAIKDDYTFSRLSRRSWHQPGRRPMLLPAQNILEQVEAVVAIDGSGSTTQQMITDFLSETYGITQTFRSFRLLVFTFDTEIYEPHVYTPENADELPAYPFHGRGGTEFNAIYDYLKREAIVPHRLVVLTDGLPRSTWGDANYCDTLFVIHSHPEIRAPFGLTAHYETRAARMLRS